MFWINSHLNVCSFLSWCSGESPPCGVSAGALLPYCQPVMFLFQRNNMLVSSGCLLLVFIISFLRESGQALESELQQMACCLCSPVHKSSLCLRNRMVVLTWHCAQLILSFGKLPYAVVLPCTRTGSRKSLSFPGLSQQHAWGTSASWVWPWHVAVSAVPWLR